MDLTALVTARALAVDPKIMHALIGHLETLSKKRFTKPVLPLESDSIVMPVKPGVLMHWHTEVKDSDARKTRD
jgi:hypothetical protein